MPFEGFVYAVPVAINSIVSGADPAVMEEFAKDFPENAIEMDKDVGSFRPPAKFYRNIDGIGNKIIIVETTYSMPKNVPATQENIDIAAGKAADTEFRKGMKKNEGVECKKPLRARYRVFYTRHNPDGSYTSKIALNDWIRYRDRINSAVFKEYGANTFRR